MASDHVLELPKFVWILKIVQLVLSVLVLALGAANVNAIAYNAHAFSVFTALFSIIILVYYFVAIHASIKLYNWIALLVLEFVAVIFWLSTWATLAALYALGFYYGYNSSYYSWYYKRSLEKRVTLDAYNGTFIAALTFSVINFIIYCVTLTFIAIAALRHHKAGRPWKSGGPTTTTTSTAADIEQPAPETTQYTPQTSAVPPAQTTQPAAPIPQQYTGV